MLQQIAAPREAERAMEQKVTIYTLAEKLNMSVSAVSRAFNPNSKLSAEKRKIILEAAEQYG